MRWDMEHSILSFLHSTAAGHQNSADKSNHLLIYYQAPGTELNDTATLEINGQCLHFSKLHFACGLLLLKAKYKIMAQCQTIHIHLKLSKDKLSQMKSIFFTCIDNNSYCDFSVSDCTSTKQKVFAAKTNLFAIRLLPAKKENK